jgi:hypothetical protein
MFIDPASQGRPYHRLGCCRSAPWGTLIRSLPARRCAPFGGRPTVHLCPLGLDGYPSMTKTAYRVRSPAGTAPSGWSSVSRQHQSGGRSLWETGTLQFVIDG